MKKLTTILILVFLSTSLFAEPKIPKMYNGEDEYSYITNDFKCCYDIQASKKETPKFNYEIHFHKTLLEEDKRITLILFFENEQQLDNFSKKIDLSEIEKEFNRTQKAMIKSGSTPNDLQKGFDYNNPPPSIYYRADGSKLKL